MGFKEISNKQYDSILNMNVQKESVVEQDS